MAAPPSSLDPRPDRRSEALAIAENLGKLTRKLLRRLDVRAGDDVDEDALLAYLLPTFRLTMGEDWWEEQAKASLAEALLRGLVLVQSERAVPPGRIVFAYALTELGKEVFRAQIRVWGWEDATRARYG